MRVCTQAQAYIYGVYTVIELELCYLTELTQTLQVLRSLEISDGTPQKGWGLGCGKPREESAEVLVRGDQITADSQPPSSFILKSIVLGWVNSSAVRVLKIIVPWGKQKLTA